MNRRSAWALVAANVAVWCGFALDLRSDGIGAARWGWDLAIVRAGGRLLLEGKPIYDAAEQTRVLTAAMRPELARFPFAYPPITAIAAAPLARLPNLAALALVWAAGIAALAWAAKRIAGDARAALWVTATFPGVAAFFSGQLAYVSLALFAVTFVLLERGRPLAAGFVASLLAFKPTMLVALPFAFAIRRERARALGGLSAGLALQGACCLVLAPAATRAYPEAAARFSAFVREHPDRFDSVTWRASFAACVGAGTLDNVLAVAAIIVCAIGAAWLMWQWRLDLRMVFATCLLATLACAWHCLPYDYVLIGLAAWLLQDRLPAAQGARLGVLAIVASWAVAFVVVPVWRRALLALYTPALVAGAAWMLRGAARARNTALQETSGSS